MGRHMYNFLLIKKSSISMKFLSSTSHYSVTLPLSIFRKHAFLDHQFQRYWKIRSLSEMNFPTRSSVYNAIKPAYNVFYQLSFSVYLIHVHLHTYVHTTYSEKTTHCSEHFSGEDFLQKNKSFTYDTTTCFSRNQTRNQIYCVFCRVFAEVMFWYWKCYVVLWSKRKFKVISQCDISFFLHFSQREFWSLNRKCVMAVKKCENSFGKCKFSRYWMCFIEKYESPHYEKSGFLSTRGFDGRIKH